MLQPCQFPKADTDGSKMQCRMPAVILPDDLSQQLQQSETGTINDTRGPGVAVYFSSDGRTRADIYLGLKLDGYRLYENISCCHPDIKMQFSIMPVISCPSDVLVYNPDGSKPIAIQVVYLFSVDLNNVCVSHSPTYIDPLPPRLPLWTRTQPGCSKLTGS